MTEPPATQVPPASAKRRPVKRVLLLLVVLVCALVAVCCSPLRAWLHDAERVRRAIDSLGIWGYPSVVLVSAIVIGCGIPRLLVCMVGSMIFGFWLGLLLTQSGAVLGYYGMFLFVRWGGREWVMQRWPKLRKWAGLIEDKGLLGVILIRQVPLHGSLINLCLGLSGVKHRHFLIGSAIGLVPFAVPVALGSAGLVKSSTAESAKYIITAVVAFAFISVACAYALRALRRRRGSAELLAELTAAKADDQTGDKA